MPYLPILAFACVYVGATLAWDLPPLVGVAYVVTSLTCFVAYALDKSAARHGGWRTPERTLLVLGLVGGWPGALLAQQWLRHKSSKRAFRRMFWTTVAANVGGFVYVSARLAAPA
ncbi:DUF1294 domain-containing protein [Massilia sp.]|uniref:DUF1294 domain-containing protein n=1 Tax=Massilia sp. TaxID=1882437 RepID=UPI0028A69865|nr:DUF1294 domain-containing protein [Massilia sp.]